MPSSTLFEKMPPNPKTDWPTPSSPNIDFDAMRPTKKVMRQPPKNAMSSRASNGGRRDGSLMRRNSSEGTATAKTKVARASLTAFLNRPDRDSA